MAKVYTDRYGNKFTYVNNVKTPINGGSNSFRNNGYQKPRKRKTGARSGMYKNSDGEKKQFIRGWRPDPFTKQGFESCFATRKNDYEPKNGNDLYENWVVTIQNSMGKKLYNGIYNTKKGVVTIPDLGLLLSPNGQGYYGRFKKR